MKFNGVDYSTVTLEELKNEELGHVAIQLLDLAETKRLCSITGREVIAEYGFKGTFNQVVEQLNEYSLHIEKEGLTEEDRKNITMRKLKLDLHIEMEGSEEHTQEMLKAIKKNDESLVIDMALQKHMLQKILHDQGMCECFNNCN